MEVAREQSESNVVRAYEPGRIRIGSTWYEGHVIVSSERVIPNWTPGDGNRVGIEHLAQAIELEPEIILLGTGPDRATPDIELMAALAARAIGIEIMNTPAACRTFNVLLNEQRRVVAALLNP